MRVALALFALSLAVRLAIVLASGFNGLYGQDAYAYVDYARQISSGRLAGPFYWPLGYPLLVAIASLGVLDLARAGQIVSLMSGSAIAPLAYWIAHDLPLDDRVRKDAAVVAGALAAVSGQLIQASLVVMSDAAALFAATVGAAALLRYGVARGSAGARTPPGGPIYTAEGRADSSRSPGRPGWLLVLAGTFLAMATGCRWIFGLLFVPAALFCIDLWRSGRLPWKAIVIAAASGTVLILPHLLIARTFPSQLVDHPWLASWSPANAIRTVFDNADGHFEYRWPPALYYLEPALHPFFISPVFSVFIARGAWAMRGTPALLLLGGWMAIQYGFLIGVPLENFRFGLAYFVPVILFAAVGLAVALPRARLRGLVLAIGLATTIPFAARGLGGLLHLSADERAVVEQLKAALPPGATVVTMGLTERLIRDTAFKVVELYHESPSTLQRLTCTARSLHLVIDTQAIARQWAGRAPARTLADLQRRHALRLIGSAARWDVYRIVPSAGC
ncbi:MAG: phospholipid carrier-dependent glycosyltransferase [Acidobacteria bacterium]|nr:phospholipid carrier-dependent glycosyltransferase [Acidobacteriota bacterium]